MLGTPRPALDSCEDDSTCQVWSSGGKIFLLIKRTSVKKGGHFLVIIIV